MAVLSRHQEAAQLARPENILNHLITGDEVSNLEKDIKFLSNELSFSFVPEAYP